MSRTLFPLAIATSFGLVSCATMSKVGKGSLALVGKTTSATTSSVASAASKVGSSVSDLSEMAVNKVHPSGGLKIVEVREKDLKTMTTGHERALAFENTRKRGFWFFNGPVDFKEPNLPDTVPDLGAEGDVDILLPPRSE